MGFRKVQFKLIILIFVCQQILNFSKGEFRP
ncbi:unnamed protein product, partial [marine sediment metagenome]